MADHEEHLGRHQVGDPEFQALLEAKACRLVGRLYEQHAGPPRSSTELTRLDEEFATAIVGYELSMIADGETPLRVAFRVELIRTVREVLLAQGEIRQLPERAETAG
jgi:hypothetical protein